MKFSTTELKRRSVELIHSSRPSVIMVALVYASLGIVLAMLSSQLMGKNMSQDLVQSYYDYVREGNLEYAMLCMERMLPPGSSYVLDIVLQLTLKVVSAGFFIFLLNTIRKTEPCLGNLLDGFGFGFKVVAVALLQTLFVSLWSLLLFVPGIIALYRYRMALYILVDNPELSPLECIRRSKQLMKGHKGELFTLDLSLLGWSLLSMMPMIGYAVQIWTVPYVGMVNALYYEKRIGRNIYGEEQGAVPPPWEM